MATFSLTLQNLSGDNKNNFKNYSLRFLCKSLYFIFFVETEIKEKARMDYSLKKAREM